MTTAKKDAIFRLPAEIRLFADRDEARTILADYYRDRTGKQPEMQPYNDSCYYYIYLFPEGDFCLLTIDRYHHPGWDYYKGLKYIDKTCIYRLKDANFLTDPDSLLQAVNPYAYRYAMEQRIPSFLLLMLPQLEQLKKAGYAIADTIIETLTETLQIKGYCEENQTWYQRRFDLTVSEIQRICRMFQKGKDLCHVIGFSRDIANAMKGVASIALWDSCRKLAKKQLLDAESVRTLCENNFSETEIDQLYHIVTRGMDNKKYFTIPSLIRYLRRLDMYEAISAKEALILLSDYIRCCHALDIKPRFDSDSLKREHDVMARNARIKLAEKKRETLNQKMAGVCQELHRYDYREQIFFIRAIDSFDDLLDEATQQSNCVASYANSIANRSSKIFVMRETSRPDKSLITIELTPEDNVRQKYMSHNRPVRNKAHSEFLERWLKHVKEINMNPNKAIHLKQTA